MKIKINVSENELKQTSIPKLLLKLSVPSVAGMISLTICQLVDTIFIGRFIGLHGIGAVTTLIPVVLVFSCFGRGLGVGGSSVISRALGKGQMDLVSQTLHTVIFLCIIISSFLFFTGLAFSKDMILILNGKSELSVLSYSYFIYLLPGLPFLSLAILSNSLIRSSGKASHAMLVMLIPAVMNIALDYIFIIIFDWGIKGAGAATSASYIFSACFCLWYFILGSEQLRLTLKFQRPAMTLLKEVLSLGITPITCQGLAALAAFVVNKTLFSLGGDVAIASYCLVQRIYILALFPLVGISQGFMPVFAYSYSSDNGNRIRELISTSLKYSLITSSVVALTVTLFSEQFASLFTLNTNLIKESATGISIMMLMLPLVAIQLIVVVYFQTLGYAFRSLITAVLQNGLFLIPLVILLPRYFGLKGIWYAYPIANVMAFSISLLMILPQWHRLFISEDVLVTKTI